MDADRVPDDSNPEAPTGLQRVFSHAPWERAVGYGRALRAGDRIFVTGTAPVAEDGSVTAPGDAHRPAGRCIESIRLDLLVEIEADAVVAPFGRDS